MLFLRQLLSMVMDQVGDKQYQPDIKQEEVDKLSFCKTILKANVDSHQETVDCFELYRGTAFCLVVHFDPIAV